MIYSVFRTCRQINSTYPLNHVHKSFMNELTLRKVLTPRKEIVCSINIFKKPYAPRPESVGIQIYRGELNTNIFRVKLLSAMTSILGIAFQPMFLQKALEQNSNTIAVVFSGSILFFFTFVTPLLLHRLTKKYVTTLYYSNETDTYEATTFTFFLNDKILNFKAGDVVVPDTPGFLTSFEVQGTPLFVDPKSFTDVKHYKRFMGYDEPLNLKLTNDIKSKKENT